MPKGKKFDAARKHFEEKEIAYRQRIRQLEFEMKSIQEKDSKLEAENKVLKKELVKLKLKCDALMKSGKLSEADVQNLIDYSNASSVLSNIMRKAVGDFYETY